MAYSILPNVLEQLCPTEADKLLSKLRCHLKHPETVALGEVGLDYRFYTRPEIKQAEAQKQFFRAQIQLAPNLYKPVTAHWQDITASTVAHQECLAILQEELPVNYSVYWQCSLVAKNSARCGPPNPQTHTLGLVQKQSSITMMT